LVTPKEVKGYTERDSVKRRANSKLEVDISRAEMYIVNYTHNDFADEDKYPAIPAPVKTAVLLLAESYAASAAEPVEHGGNYKSGSIDDYSFTVAETSNMIGNLELASLLDEYIIEKQKSGITMKMRKL